MTILHNQSEDVIQPAITYSKLAIKTLEQCEKYLQN